VDESTTTAGRRRGSLPADASRCSGCLDGGSIAGIVGQHGVPLRAATRKSDDLLVPVAQVRLITGRPASVNANWAPSRVGAEGLRWKNACGGWSKRAKAFEPPKTRTRRCNTLDQSFHMLASASLHALLAWASPSAIKSTSNMLQSKGRITLKR
jgi:hypothetical protein